MKPKSKLQLQIVEVDSRLPKIAADQEAWALKHCLKHEATRLKNGTVSCLDCGHQWIDKLPLANIIDHVCPNCSTEVKMIDTRKKVFNEWNYFLVISTFEGFQLFRLFKVHGNYKAGTPAHRHMYEVSRIYLLANGKYEIVGYNHMDTHYVDTWTGDFTLRARHNIRTHAINAIHVHPTVKVLPQIRRNGFKGHFHRISPFYLFQKLLTDNQAETLLKVKQVGFLKAFIQEDYGYSMYADSIKICVRKKYIVKDFSFWKDYVDLLRYFGKDLKNPKFICPPDLKVQHDKLMNKRTAIMAEQARARELAEIERRQKNLEKAILEYSNDKGKYFDLEFVDGNISIHVLKSVEEFKEEGTELKHCVYTNAYYSKKESLVMSARVDGKRTETIEVNLKRMEIVQSRGMGNAATKYNKKIVALIEKNLPKIRSVLQKKSKDIPQQQHIEAA